MWGDGGEVVVIKLSQTEWYKVIKKNYQKCYFQVFKNFCGKIHKLSKGMLMNMTYFTIIFSVAPLKT